MTDLDALLAGIVSDPLEETRWLVLADWLEENDDPRRAEFLRLHRRMLATCCEPDSHPERAQWQSRMTELLIAGVEPCVPQETLTLPGGVPMTFSFIPPGAFLMGEQSPANRKRVDGVGLTRGFLFGAYPVTKAQWKAVMRKSARKAKNDNLAASAVTRGECERFCESLSKSTGRRITLPNETEWEYACRAGTTTEFYFGDDINADVANYKGDCTWNNNPPGVNRGKTIVVGSFPPNPWGLYDLHGNLWEWCTDWHTPDDQTYVVCRGGCYGSNPNECRSAYRGGFPPRVRDSICGVRVCLRLP